MRQFALIFITIVSLIFMGCGDNWGDNNSHASSIPISITNYSETIINDMLNTQSGNTTTVTFSLSACTLNINNPTCEVLQ